jgi:leucyl-tRNA synthetase
MPRTPDQGIPPNENNREDIHFPHLAVEAKWMHQWVQDGIYVADNNSTKPKFYVLDMFPYPSGVGLHLGHVEGYTASDITARYKRMNGYEVLHPMGWDAFGLPTENYAIATGKDPHKVTADNANTFREQCIKTGFGIDWTREIDTSNAEYYKWTQQIFLELYENGLAYKDEAPVNWCGGCKTVIANEQVQEGHCERCNCEVEIKNIEQWFLKITDYADRLDEGLQYLDWPESTKEAQSNWIGRTEGYEISIPLKNSGDLNVFTTEPEVLAQSSVIMMAPDHPHVMDYVSYEQHGKVEAYIQSVSSQKEIERKKQKRKSSEFTGTYGINPLTGEEMPIYVSSSVLMDEYGGFKIESKAADKKATLFPDRKVVVDSLGENAKATVRYKLRDWLVSRERYWGAPIPIVHCDDCGDQPVPASELPILLPDMDDYTPTGVPPLARSEEFMNTHCPNCGGHAVREAKTLDTFVDSSFYQLRYPDARNENALGDPGVLDKWLPVDLYVGGAEFATGHLLYARFITHVLHDLGYINFTEPFTSLRHQGMVIAEDGRKMSKRWGNVVSPESISNQYGSDVLRLYMMFLGPLDMTKTWNTKGIAGSRRFVDKVWQLQNKVHDSAPSDSEYRQTIKLVTDVTSDIEAGKYNTAVSTFMKYINFVDQQPNGMISKQSYESFLKLLAPFAPFISEELWQRSGNTYSIHEAQWPEVSNMGEAEMVELKILVNGKYMGSIQQEKGASYADSDILDFLKSHPDFAEQFAGIESKSIIYKPGKIFNILTS